MNTNQGSPMPRSITSHIVNPANDRLRIKVLDEPGSGGENHEYLIESPDWDEEDNVLIAFQNGPIAEVGVNGVTHEALLAIVIDRLEAFQRGSFACKENGEALLHLKHAMESLQARTLARMARGVEGTHQK